MVTVHATATSTEWPSGGLGLSYPPTPESPDLQRVAQRRSGAALGGGLGSSTREAHGRSWIPSCRLSLLGPPAEWARE